MKSGLYPNEQVIEVFGEQVKWPGLGPDGKFTNGSFTDPLIKPSFIPAETLNLLLDNMQRVIEEAGLEPNNIEQDQLLRALRARKTVNVSGKRAATLVVGTALSGHTFAEVDYLCDGVDDQEEINAAVQALPEGGGKIVIREGAYRITANIVVDRGCATIEGMGASTVLAFTGAAVFVNGNNVTVARLYINSSISVYGNGCTISGNTCNGNLRGIYIGESGNSIKTTFIKIVANTCNENAYGIYVDSSMNTVIDNTCIRGMGREEDYTSAHETLEVFGKKNFVANNYIMGKNYKNYGDATNMFVNNKYN